MANIAKTATSIKVDARLVDEARRILRSKSKTEAVRTALREIVALKRFKKTDEKVCR
jgi:Arc/MetJ family transcription regulator